MWTVGSMSQPFLIFGQLFFGFVLFFNWFQAQVKEGSYLFNSIKTQIHVVQT